MIFYFPDGCLRAVAPVRVLSAISTSIWIFCDRDSYDYRCFLFAHCISISQQHCRCDRHPAAPSRQTAQRAAASFSSLTFEKLHCFSCSITGAVIILPRLMAVLHEEQTTAASAFEDP